MHPLAGSHAYGPLVKSVPVAAMTVHHGQLHHELAIRAVPDARKPKGPTGMVTKRAKFYELYSGPKLKELNATKASVKLSRDGSTFTFTGTVQGKINSDVAVFVWGIDRSGSLGTGPFPNRPNVRFDSVVAVKLDASLTPTARVIDFTTGSVTILPAGSARIKGKTETVTVSASLLPSTGLAPSAYRFNFWPDYLNEQGVASFLPETGDAQVGRSK
jgi:hypothetical protein